MDRKVNQSCPTIRTRFGFRTTLKGFDPLQSVCVYFCEDIY